jgi:hypothetical protein
MGQKLASGCWGWDSGSKVLSVTGLNSATSGGAWSKEWSLTWG